MRRGARAPLGGVGGGHGWWWLTAGRPRCNTAHSRRGRRQRRRRRAPCRCRISNEEQTCHGMIARGAGSWQVHACSAPTPAADMPVLLPGVLLSAVPSLLVIYGSMYALGGGCNRRGLRQPLRLFARQRLVTAWCDAEKQLLQRARARESAAAPPARHPLGRRQPGAAWAGLGRAGRSRHFSTGRRRTRSQRRRRRPS